tara:strand:- start:653 stop:1750 length:1098 start_codon:yes stop_codon:yes gene_type:complete
MNIPGRYWQTLDDGRIQCQICPRLCKLRNGQRGLCFVRQALENQIYLTTYNRSSGFCIDPIEKKPLNHFLPGTPILSFGTAGCNLTCKFCQNWDISKSTEFDKLTEKASPEMIAETAKSYGCRSIALTYNDPVIFMEYAVDVAKACNKLGIKTVAVTAGYILPQARIEFFSNIDAANIDLKAFNEKFYKKICGGELKPVLDTLIYLKKETNIWFELTNLLIPDENDSPEEINLMTKWIFENLGSDIPLHFSAFHPDWKMKNHKITPHSKLTRSREIALSNGLRYVYIGNVHDKNGSSTYCYNCEKLLIGRDWFELSDWNLNQNGHCIYCGTKCEGIFEKSHGDWGSKRQPVKIQNDNFYLKAQAP